MRLGIQGKLYGLAAVLLVCMSVIGVLAISNLGAVNRLGGSMLADRVVPLQQVSDARSLLGDIDSQILREQLQPSDKQRAQAEDDVAKIDKLPTSRRCSCPTRRRC